VKIGQYIRKKIIVLSVIYLNVLIQRWLCKNIKNNPTHHKTFSLLPQMLVPYHQQDINSILETAEYKANHSYEQTKDFVQQKTDQSLEYSQITNINKLIEQTFIKINAIAELKTMISQSGALNSNAPVASIITFIKTYKSNVASTTTLKVSNAEKLALDFFFHFQNPFYFKRQFLFGTPSQNTRG
jgi:hypothetical protein